MTPEYCLFWIQHWSMCMTKSEWSGWAQFAGALLSVFLAAAIGRFIALGEKRTAEEEVELRAQELRRLALSFVDDVRHACTLRPDPFEFTFDMGAERVRRLAVVLGRHAKPIASAPIWDIDDLNIARELSSIEHLIHLAVDAINTQSFQAEAVVAQLQSTCETLLEQYNFPPAEQTATTTP